MKKTMAVKLIGLFILLIATAEIALRLLGYKPLNSNTTPVYIQSLSGEAYLPDPAYMLRLNTGSYPVTINGAVLHQVTHANNERVVPVTTGQTGNSKLFFLGCSFTYGMGVSDTQTFAALIAQAHSHLAVRNLARPGLSPLHSYVLLKQHINQHDTPTVAYVSFSKMHLCRSVLSKTYARAVYEAYLYYESKGYWKEHPETLQGFTYMTDQLTIDTVAACNMYRHLPFSRTLALSYLLNNTYDLLYDKWHHKEYTETNLKVVSLLTELCHEHNVTLVMFDFFDSDEMQPYRQLCETKGVPFISSSINWRQGGMYNYPHDPHPSPKGHKAIFEFLDGHLKSTLFAPALAAK